MPVGGGKGGGGGAGNVRAGGAYFELFAVDNFTHILEKMKAKVLAFADDASWIQPAPTKATQTDKQLAAQSKRERRNAKRASLQSQQFHVKP